MAFSIGRKKNHKIRGKFVTLYGAGLDDPELAAQFQLLKDSLAIDGHEAVVVNFPQTGMKSAGAIEEYRAGKYGAQHPYIASTFHAVDHFDGGLGIEHLLQQGTIVLADGYVVATACDQGVQLEDHLDRARFFKWLNDFEFKTLGVPKPDLNLILNMPPEKRGKSKQSKQAEERHQRVTKVLKEVSQLFANTKVVECVETAGDADKRLTGQQIHNKIWNLFRRIVLNSKHAQ